MDEQFKYIKFENSYNFVKNLQKGFSKPGMHNLVFMAKMAIITKRLQ